MLVLARKINETIIIGDDIEISIVDIRSDQVKLGINAPNKIKILRHEVYVAIQEENRLAMQSASELPKFEGFSKNPNPN